MESTDDSGLVRQYVERRSDDTFALLVERHINLVYSVALRHVGNPHHAEEVTQAVFIILAKKAAALRHEKALSSWLFQTTRLTAHNFLRSEMRRQKREQEAYMESTFDQSGSSTWESIAPLLDDAVAALKEQERRAVILRFYEGRNLNEVGVAMGTSEEAAKKRVARALEKLHSFFLRRGVASTADGLTSVVSANAVQAAPAALAISVHAVAIAKGAAVGGSTLTLVEGALKIMAWTKAKTAIVTGAIAIILVGGTATVLVELHMKAAQFTPATAPWSDAGASTPKAALQSLAWALTQGKTDRAEQLIQWDEKGAQNNSQLSLEHQIILTAVLPPALKDIRSFKILSIKQTDGSDEVIVNLEKNFQNNNIRPFSVTAKLRRIRGQWRAVGNIEYFSNGSTSMLLPFTGSF